MDALCIQKIPDYDSTGVDKLHDLSLLMPIASVAALAFAAFKAQGVFAESEGTDDMVTIAAAIRKGANAYLRRQYTSVAKFFLLVAVVFVVLYFLGFVNFFTPFALLLGGALSGLSGFLGMRIATAANSRTANGARHSLNRALGVSFSAGTAIGFIVVGLSLAETSFWYLLMRYVVYADSLTQAADVSSAMINFVMGASLMALFARVGGGIFTKAADVGADLVGKVEAGIPEDDPRNPAVIADNVGDNVGDVAGMGADLYESYSAARVSCMALAVSAGFGFAGMSLPMAVCALGVLAAIVGSFFVKTSEGASQKSLLTSLRTGTYLASVIVVVGSYFLVNYILGPGHFGVFVSVAAGLIAGNLIGYFTEYYTSASYKPTQKLADSSETGAATIIISGLSLGMMSTAIPVIIVCIAVILSFFFCNGAADYSTGLYGVAMSAVGMLSTLGITLATDAFGPICDNAGGIAEMTGLDEEVRDRTDALDSIGNTTAATGKGYAIGSAAITALCLVASFIDQINFLDPNYVWNLEVMNPTTLCGIFIGAMLPFIFAAMTMDSVNRAAMSIVNEVRRQFREIKGLMEGTAEPDYEICVDLCTKSAIQEITAPSVLAIVAPILVGIILGPSAVAGLLAGTTVSGFILACMMSNAGGAWDNAKKYIEAGSHGGKGSEQHKAAVVGDTVGDPFKDTSGPSINILMKLVSMVAIVFASVILQFAILG